MLAKKPIRRRMLGETIGERAVKKELIAKGGETTGIFIRTRGAHGENIELHHRYELSAKEKYLGLKIAHLLFPKNFPNPVGVKGEILYSRYIAPHRELRDFQKFRATNTQRGSNYLKKIGPMCRKIGDKITLHKEEIEALIEKLEKTGILVDYTPLNWAIRKDGIVCFDVATISDEKLKAALATMRIPESRKKVILKLLEQYKKQ